jgi:D-alanine--D-alanine ligase
MEVIHATRLPGNNLTEAERFGKIGVLMGGPSSEREISLKSGKAVCESLKKLGIEFAAIDITTDAIEPTAELLRSHRIQCAFLALHGRFGEDGQIQEILDDLNIPYTGSGVLASKLAMDKIASHRIFEAYNLNVPKYKVVEKSSYTLSSYDAGDFEFPVVVKPATHGSSVGLTIVDTAEALGNAIAFAFTFDERVLIEEYIRGREVTAGILDEKALPLVEIIPKKRIFDYEAKYQAGMTEYIVPARLEDTVAVNLQKKALTAHKVLGCVGCSRVDIILREDSTAFILEVNTIPGLTQTSLLPKAANAAGIDFASLCVKLIRLAYEKAKV